MLFFSSGRDGGELDREWSEFAAKRKEQTAALNAKAEEMKKREEAIEEREALLERKAAMQSKTAASNMAALQQAEAHQNAQLLELEKDLRRREEAVAADIKLLCDQQRLLEAKFPPMSTSQLLAGLSLGTGAQAQAGMGAMGT